MAPACVRDAIHEGNTRNARTIKRILKASRNKEAGAKSFSASVLRILIIEKRLCLEAKIPKKKPLMIYKSELTIRLKDEFPMVRLRFLLFNSL